MPQQKFICDYRFSSGAYGFPKASQFGAASHNRKYPTDAGAGKREFAVSVMWAKEFVHEL